MCLYVLVTQLCLSLYDPMDCSLARLLCPWNSPGKYTGMGCHSLHQRMFLTQELNQDLLHCRQILYGLSHQGSQLNVLEQPKWKEIFIKKQGYMYIYS